jgi:hypothetical protein
MTEFFKNEFQRDNPFTNAESHPATHLNQEILSPDQDFPRQASEGHNLDEVRVAETEEDIKSEDILNLECKQQSKISPAELEKFRKWHSNLRVKVNYSNDYPNMGSNAQGETNNSINRDTNHRNITLFPSTNPVGGSTNPRGGPFVQNSPPLSGTLPTGAILLPSPWGVASINSPYGQPIPQSLSGGSSVPISPLAGYRAPRPWSSVVLRPSSPVYRLPSPIPAILSQEVLPNPQNPVTETPSNVFQSIDIDIQLTLQAINDTLNKVIYRELNTLNRGNQGQLHTVKKYDSRNLFEFTEDPNSNFTHRNKLVIIKALNDHHKEFNSYPNVFRFVDEVGTIQKKP